MIERWCNHTGPFIEDERFIKIKYEDLNLRFEETCENIGKTIGYDITPTSKPILNERTVSARKGIVGDWKNYFKSLANERIISYTNKKGIRL
jgi:hypothetical protein